MRLIHEPTGLVASSQEERSQLQNREKALNRLKAMYAAKVEEERAAELDAIAGKQAQVGWGSQIRSYVLQPYQMVKDLRTEVESGNVSGVLDGDIDEFMEGWLRWRRAQSDDRRCRGCAPSRGLRRSGSAVSWPLALGPEHGQHVVLQEPRQDDVRASALLLAPAVDDEGRADDRLEVSTQVDRGQPTMTVRARLVRCVSAR